MENEVKKDIHLEEDFPTLDFFEVLPDGAFFLGGDDDVTTRLRQMAKWSEEESENG